MVVLAKGSGTHRVPPTLPPPYQNRVLPPTLHASDIERFGLWDRIGSPVFQAKTDAAIAEINTDIEEIKGQLSGSLANLGSSSKDTSSKLKVDHFLKQRV